MRVDQRPQRNPHRHLTCPLPDAGFPIFPVEPRHDASRRQGVYPKPVDFRKSINGLAALVELDIFNPVLFVFLNRPRSQVKVLYWERNGFCLWLKRLEAERFKTKPDADAYAAASHPSSVG